MPRDELRQPLRKRSTTERLWARRPGGLTLAVALAVAGFGGGATWLTRQPHRLAGEPVVTVGIPPVEELKTAATDAPAETAPDDVAEVPAETEMPADQGVEEATIVVSARRPMKPAPLALVAEACPDGTLPRISSNGKKPSDVYAQTTPMGVTSSDRPKIAILLGGMGLNQHLTSKATKDLPGDVTFGFAPYGGDLQAQVNRARAQGHEIMLQLPMEPMGYPANDPGPNTLLAEAAAEDNLKALHWNMSRFAGYTGITNYMGSRFLATPSGLKPVMMELKSRGLTFLEDSSAVTGPAAEMAKATGLPIRQADVVIDANPDAASIQAALAGLEKKAKADGIAIGTGAGLEVTIDTVAEWARQLAGKGIVLVPISATYRGRIG